MPKARLSLEASRSILFVLSLRAKLGFNSLKLFQEQCIKNLGNVLKAAGSSWEQVVKVNVYLKNMDDFASMNQVYEKCETF